MADDLSTKVLTDYPMLAFLLNDPEIGPLLLQAVDPNQGFDAATLQMKIMQTNWWKTSSASVRQWETLVNTDPETAQRRRDAQRADLLAQASQLGVNIDSGKLAGLVEQSLQLGLAAGSGQMRELIAGATSMPIASVPSLRGIANGEYLVPASDGDLGWWAHEIAAGHQSEMTYRNWLTTMAIGRFPQIKTAIEQGITPGQYFAPYRQTIAQQLELGSADQVDLVNDPRWSKVMGVAQTDGTQRPMTLSEATVYARQQPEWSNTAVSRQQGADLTSQLLKEFGALS